MSRDDDSGDAAGRFHILQPLRDPESNWAVDLAKNLEDYLLKICSGEISGEDRSHLSVNFAEAALLLQGSVQVYSRKVEYLYTLVLNALEFVSQKRQEDHEASTSNQTEESHPNANIDEESDIFWSLDNIPVESKNCLDTLAGKDAPSNYFLKPPANLVVLEGDCLESTGDGTELESYLLATCDVYKDFILLDPCDAASVNYFLKENRGGSRNNSAYISKTIDKCCKSFLSPTQRSGGTAQKSGLGKNQDVNPNDFAPCGPEFAVRDHDIRPDPHPCDISENNIGFDIDDGYSPPAADDSEDDEDDDPWKPLNPHEPGNLKVKPFKKVKAFKGHGSSKEFPLMKEFPLAKLHGPISSEFTEMWQKQCCAPRGQESGSPALYEKLRQSLVDGRKEACDGFGNSEIYNEDNGFDGEFPDFGQPYDDLPENLPMDEEANLPDDKLDNDAVNFDSNACGVEDQNSQKSLEDLCRSHLDALLANIAESEKQTELAARVSTWKQKIEHNLEEQDSRPPFDIHDYGERILEKLTLDADSRNCLSFSDVVRGQEKHDVARSFSSLLQLVNNGNVELKKGGADADSICYTAANPFYVNLLRYDKQKDRVQLQSSKKRAKSPATKGRMKGDRKSARENSPPPSASGFTATIPLRSSCKSSLKLGKTSRCTPESKRRRRSRFLEPVDLHSAS